MPSPALCRNLFMATSDWQKLFIWDQRLSGLQAKNKQFYGSSWKANFQICQELRTEKFKKHFFSFKDPKIQNSTRSDCLLKALIYPKIKHCCITRTFLVHLALGSLSELKPSCYFIPNLWANFVPDSTVPVSSSQISLYILFFIPVLDVRPWCLLKHSLWASKSSVEYPVPCVPSPGSGVGVA